MAGTDSEHAMAESDAAAGGLERKLATILSADVAAYSRLMAEDEERTLQTFRAHKEVFEKLVELHRGRVFNTAGDGILAEFSRPVEAGGCATEIQAALRTRNDQLASERQLAVLDTQELQLRADAKAKQAALDLAKINLGYTRIVAPVGGMVSERGVRDGQYVHAGSQVITVVPLDNVWVLANYKETQLTHVAIGQRAEI